MGLLEVFRQPKQVVSEIIGRTATVLPFWRSSQTVSKTVDQTQTDYEFWDKLRRGKQSGYKFGGLFCMPILQTLSSHVLGDGPRLALVEGGDPDNDADPRTYTDKQLETFMQHHYAFFADSLIDLYGLGDHYVIVNQNDATLSVAPPHTVEVDRDPFDYRRITQYTITTKTDDATIKDIYRDDGRTVEITWNTTEDGHQAGQVETYEFANLIGRIPVVHWPNDRAANETHGRPIYEPLLRLFSRYDDLLEKAIDGAELMGNPIPTFEGMENISETIEANATEEDPTYTDREDNTQTRKTIRFDLLAAIFVGKGGQFKFAAPSGGFTEDIRNMLKSLFLLLLDFTRIPEFMWGGAIASSKASAEVQWPPFVQYIQYKRAQWEGVGMDAETGRGAQGGLLELADIWLRCRALIDPRIVVDAVAVQWPDLMMEDQQLQFEKVQWASGTGKLTDKTALELLDVVDDPSREIKDAAAEAEQARAEAEEFQNNLQAAMREAGEGEPQPAPRSNGRATAEAVA